MYLLTASPSRNVCVNMVKSRTTVRAKHSDERPNILAPRGPLCPHPARSLSLFQVETMEQLEGQNYAVKTSKRCIVADSELSNLLAKNVGYTRSIV